jgi:hypothetical protein
MFKHFTHSRRRLAPRNPAGLDEPRAPQPMPRMRWY